MKFQPGHKFGNHNNHYKGGRFTKEQYELLSSLASKGMQKWKEILEKTSDKWLPLQAQVTRDIVNKFAPDLTEVEGKFEHTTAGERTAGFLRDAADRISRKAQDNADSAGSGGDQGSNARQD